MNDRLDLVEVFVQVVKSGNFAGAASHLNLSRSAVGKSIARLEQKLGVQLFQRTTRQQHLTESGHVFYEYSVRALNELKSAEAALAFGLSTPSGKLRISVPIIFGRMQIAPVLTRMMRQYPELNMEISFNDHNVDLVQEGFDLAVRMSGLVDTPNLVARRLATQKMVVCGSPEYFARHGTPQSIADLTQHHGILYSRPGYDKRWLIRDTNGRIQQVDIKTRLFLNDIQAITDAAVDGHGLAWLPCWLISAPLQKGLLSLALEPDHVLTSDIHLVWPSADYIPGKTRSTIDYLVEQVSW